MDENRNTVMPEAETEESLSEILQIRRDKLAALQAEGRDPFAQVRLDIMRPAMATV